MTDEFVLDSSKLRKQILSEARKTWKPSFTNMGGEESAKHLVDVCLRICGENQRLAVEELKKQIDARVWLPAKFREPVMESINSVFKFAEGRGGI